MMWEKLKLALRVLLVVCASVCCAQQAQDEVIAAYNSEVAKTFRWGAYRPNLYMGIRPKLAESLLSGLFWMDGDNLQGVQDIRHKCDQNQAINGFGWEKYDLRLGGRQFFNDDGLKFRLTTDFVKSDLGWGLKVRGEPQQGYEDKSIAIVFYAGLEGAGELRLDGDEPANGFAPGDTVGLRGYSPELGNFSVQVSDGPSSNRHKSVPRSRVPLPSLDPLNTHYASLTVPTGEVWKAKDIFVAMLSNSIEDLTTNLKVQQHKVNPDPSCLLCLRNLNEFRGNLHYVEKIFTGAFEFDVLFSTPQDDISFDNLESMINSTLATFDERFDASFELQKPFTHPKYTKFSKEFLSNLMGGIGYFYGDQLVDRTTKLNEETYEDLKLVGTKEHKSELFCATPSRTAFPRGFYWDEGFHLLPIFQYDLDLALEILKSWFDLIDHDGWIAREQIPGDEARSAVPEQFQVQSPEIANPPTMMLLFTELLDKAKANLDNTTNRLSFGFEDDQELFNYSANDTDGFNFKNTLDAHLKYPELLIEYAKEIYPKLKLHYEWFRRTQQGEIEEFDRDAFSSTEGYRWRGRTFDHSLPSGLDDYPRARIPDIAELNVDLISWIGAMTRAMKKIATLLDEVEDAKAYSDIEYAIQRNIDDLHWNDELKMYCDLSVDMNDENEFVCHKGYISLFPFLLKLMPPSSSHLYDVIQLISDPDELFTPFGIRSLSKNDKHYRTKENYWRSPIWINMNYLILESLHHYGTGENRQQLVDDRTWELANSTYTELRINLVENVFKGWQETGFAFEQYDDITGAPQKNKHFYGWTSMVTVIMNMPYDLS